ncbi:hypothetical protein Y032_0161g3391 [Ancylostoma ceylanicum]|uniref:Uncharacterized protein n=1 Tax=Ancylostoma ceylanicum TaxID=53326 RepID=A0A016SY09_9BILA|nr:hypothetical protein Y032_0161g3391 [Ancylostoma ceylanicum]
MNCECSTLIISTIIIAKYLWLTIAGGVPPMIVRYFPFQQMVLAYLTCSIFRHCKLLLFFSVLILLLKAVQEKKTVGVQVFLACHKCCWLFTLLTYVAHPEIGISRLCLT